MGAEIRSASVGGAVGGGVLLPEAEGPGYTTWPDTVARSVEAIANAWARSRQNPDAESDDEDDEYPGFQTPTGAPPMPGAAPAMPPATGFGGSAYLLLAAVAGVFLLPKLLR